MHASIRLLMNERGRFKLGAAAQFKEPQLSAGNEVISNPGTDTDSKTFTDYLIL